MASTDGGQPVAETTRSRFEQLRGQRMRSPEFRQRYERTRRSIAQVQQILHLIDAHRQGAGLSKAEVARRLGTHPATVRRLFASGSNNPTLRTLLELMDVLGIQMRLHGRQPATTRKETRTLHDALLCPSR